MFFLRHVVSDGRQNQRHFTNGVPPARRELDATARREASLRRALRLQVGHQVRQQLVEDAGQPVLIVEEEVVYSDVNLLNMLTIPRIHIEKVLPCSS